MNEKEVIYEARPMQADLDETTKTFIQIMNNIASERGIQWSFSGGFARDLYLGYPWNDYDVCTNSNRFFINKLKEMNLLVEGEQVDTEIAHDYYYDPYDFSRHPYPIHWIDADDNWAYAPRHFDFTINHICLKSDGYFHAPTYAWKDLDKKIIRRANNKITSNMALRAIRFSSKFGFTIDSELEEEIKSLMEKPMDVVVLLRNLKKMVEDGVEETCYSKMKKRNFPYMEETSNMDEYMEKVNNMILSGDGYREPVHNTYSF